MRATTHMCVRSASSLLSPGLRGTAARGRMPHAQAYRVNESVLAVQPAGKHLAVAGVDLHFLLLPVGQAHYHFIHGLAPFGIEFGLGRCAAGVVFLGRGNRLLQGDAPLRLHGWHRLDSSAARSRLGPGHAPGDGKSGGGHQGGKMSFGIHRESPLVVVCHSRNCCQRLHDATIDLALN